jgi:hypothetical protein
MDKQRISTPYGIFESIDDAVCYITNNPEILNDFMLNQVPKIKSDEDLEIEAMDKAGFFDIN